MYWYNDTTKRTRTTITFSPRHFQYIANKIILSRIVLTISENTRFTFIFKNTMIFFRSYDVNQQHVDTESLLRSNFGFVYTLHLGPRSQITPRNTHISNYQRNCFFNSMVSQLAFLLSVKVSSKLYILNKSFSVFTYIIFP